MDSKQKYNQKIHRRRSIRLKGYNYSQNGAYFITVRTRNKGHSLGEIVRKGSSYLRVALNGMGEIAKQCWLKIPDHFPDVMIDEFVIMPNHVHGIIVINDIKKRILTMHHRRGTACRAPTSTIERFGKPSVCSIPTIIRSYKSAVTKLINEFYRTPGQSFWQRNYYEHVIRNDNDLYDVRNYIRDNPQKWDSDEYNPVCYHHRRGTACRALQKAAHMASPY